MVRRNAARLLAEVGDASTPALKSLVNDPFYDVRMEAIRALVRGGSTDTIPWIAERLGDQDRQVAELAVDVLPRLGSGGAQALAPFLEDMSQPVDLRFRALRALRSEGTAGGLGESLLTIVKRHDENAELRALALALALGVGATFDPPEAVLLLLPIALSSNDLEHQSAAIDGLVSLGPTAATAVRKSLVERSVPQYTFNRLLSALPAMARKDATKELESLFDALSGADRDNERASIVQALGRFAPEGLADYFVNHWAQMGATSRREAVRVFRARSDDTASICEIALPDDSPEVRRAAFELALKTPELSTNRCIEAVCNETQPSQYSEFLEMLTRERPDNDSRGFLLGLLHEADSELFESLTAALDVFTGDEEVVRALAAQHDLAYRKQLEHGSDDADFAWRVRRAAIRTISRVGGPSAIEFLRIRARSERALDGALATEAVRGLARISPDDPLLLDLLDPPSLPAVRVESAIAAAERGRGQGLRALARDVQSLDGDMRRRALNALSRGHSTELRRGFLKLLALDEQARFGDENRADAIRDLAFVEGPESLSTLVEIAGRDRSVDSRIEAIRALGHRGGDESAEQLVRVGDQLLSEPPTDERELQLQAVATALGDSRSAVGVEHLLSHLFERPLHDLQKHLLDPDSVRQVFERRRLYDREHAAARGLGKLGTTAGQAVVDWLRRLRDTGLLQYFDPTFLLDLAEEWTETLPEASDLLAAAAGTFGQDLEPRFRSHIHRAQIAKDRRSAAQLYDSAHALASSGAVDAAFARILGSAEVQWARRPRVWLRCARLISRADAAFAESKADEGVRFLDDAIRNSRGDTRTLVDVASSFHAHGMAIRARDVMAQAVQLAPSDHVLVDSYAWLCLNCGDAELARERFRLAETLDDDGNSIRSARFGQMAALDALGRMEEALGIARWLIHDDPEFVEIIRHSSYLPKVQKALETTLTASRPAFSDAEPDDAER
ncbi:MAG: HEAT repeat domain-containing protein [Planctomycetes bacterium]|nr:HEAT repeat domain-containing protein [Planctomycetota bacterium]